MKTFRIATTVAVVGFGFVLGGCAAQSGTPVDYATLATQSCSLASAEITALNAVSSKLPVADQEALVKVAPLVTAACAALAQATQQPETVYTTLLTLLPDLTILIVDSKGQ